MTDDDFDILVGRIGLGVCRPEEIAAALAHAEAAAARAKRLRDATDDALLAHVQRHGPVAIGHVLYSAGHRAKTWAVNKPAVLDALLIHTGGDLNATADLLTRQPFKHGSVRRVLPETTFASLFRTTREARLGLRLMRGRLAILPPTRRG